MAKSKFTHVYIRMRKHQGIAYHLGIRLIVEFVSDSSRQRTPKISRIYTLRNLAHIETEAKKQIEIEIEHAKLGYWRMQPFLEKIEKFLSENSGS